MSGTARRKDAHLQICLEREVESAEPSLLREVGFWHEALPELSLEQIDIRCEVFGRSLAAPILITGMTGGTERAGRINRALARAAQKLGLAMGLGSQRAMLEEPERAASYCVREVAPGIPLLANLGLVQARSTDPDRLIALIEAVGADALCLHLNAAQELAQDEGDRDFRGGLEALHALRESLPIPVVVKETGCGISPRCARKLREIGIEWVDVAGRGGTSWPGVEAHRGGPRQQAMGGLLREWGVPTAVSILAAREAGLRTIGSGGLRDAMDLARALALGAELGGLALPFLRAHEAAGDAGLLDYGERLIDGLQRIMLLAGARDLRALRSRPLVLGPTLRHWLESAESCLENREARA